MNARVYALLALAFAAVAAGAGAWVIVALLLRSAI
jgi:hypothetical protein